MKYNSEEITEKFVSFLQSFRDVAEPIYPPLIKEMYFKDQVSLDVDFDDIMEIDTDLAEQYIEEPEIVFPALCTALKEVVKLQCNPQKDKEYFVRVFNLPKTQIAKIRDITEEHVHKLVQITGVVTLASYRDFFIREAVYSCERCGEYITVVNDNYFVAKKPITCSSPACKRNGPFKLVTKYSKPVLIQTLKINDFPEDLQNGEMPEDFDCIVEGDLVGKVLPGNKVEVVGIVSLKQASVGKVGDAKSPIFTKYMKGFSLRVIGVEQELSDITDEEVEEIQELSEKPNLREILISSFAPTIKGYENIKYALLLQAFGCPQKVFSDGTKLRGDSHILLIGDPSTGKSQLTYFATKLSPRGIFCTGRGSSGAGLTGSATQLGDRRWTIQPGVLSLTDGGIAGIDELGRMEQSDREAIHTALEQQEIPQHKAGLKVTLQSRCAVVASANPVHDRFDRNKPFAEQFSLPVTILTRFDFIFCFTDDPNLEKDLMIAEHITSVRAYGEKAIQNNGCIPVQKMRKYIMYARKNIFPEFDKDVLDAMKNWYGKTRQQGGGGKPMSATTRQVEAIQRLVYANARMRLSKKVEMCDYEDVIKLYEDSRKIMIDPETNEFDVDMIETGRPKSQQDKISIIIDIISKLDQKNNNEGAMVKEVYEDTRAENISDAFTRKIIEELKQKGDVYEPRPDRLKLSLL